MRHELAGRFNCERSWQFDSDCFPMTIQKPVTLQEAKSIARHLGLTLRQVRSGAYRVNFRDGNESTASYTDNLEDAITTVVEMARARDVMQAVTKPSTKQPKKSKVLLRVSLASVVRVSQPGGPSAVVAKTPGVPTPASVDRRAAEAMTQYSVAERVPRAPAPPVVARPGSAAMAADEQMIGAN
jgi:hypothetical protein